ncbi:hypothetical protein PTRA_a1523 [Pseudoalteromonas translucida KMM 520]|uniref:Uncharacterized protein n=1 Tax=Pseudoalteromonas translucida KMM 520 TaxID=1315283 RepID=A0A0U2MP43_9GAMM|nr:hypothetical protein PTRA_a1523 [Pseudoalteromonas translucida KMM 520]
MQKLKAALFAAASSTLTIKVQVCGCFCRCEACLRDGQSL